MSTRTDAAKIPQRSALPKPLKRAIPQRGTIAQKKAPVAKIDNCDQNALPSCQMPRKRTCNDAVVGKSAAKAPRLVQQSTKRVLVEKQPTEVVAEKKPKRAAWDIKGKLQDAEAALHSWREKFSESRDGMVRLEGEKQMLGCDLNSKTVELAMAEETILSLQKKLIDKEQELQTMLEEKKKFEIEMERKIDRLQSDLNERQSKVERLETELRASCEESRDKSAAIERLGTVLRANETQRRHLHNVIQELKGNIRVYCRVRPLLPEEIRNESNHICFPEENVVQLLKFGDSCHNDGQRTVHKNDFKFDRVFDEHSSQQEIFEEVSHLVQSAVDGYNVCLFAYGRTGSGKTFTMEGPSDAILEPGNRDLGVIPRSLNLIFPKVEELEEKGWMYEVEVSALEIYNEQIRDLLTPTQEQLKVRSNQAETLLVEKVTTEAQVYALLKTARRHRAVAATHCNQHSSRSHSVFCIKISGRNGATGERCEGTLNLVDLAGSERLKESRSEGERLTETKKINSSLSTLKTVIMALAQKKEHVPFRDSKLTYLLRNSLGGNSKTLMMVNVSPRFDHYGETLDSLRFAAQVNQCHIGTATKIHIK